MRPEQNTQRPRSESQTSELRGIRPAGLSVRDSSHRASKELSIPSPSLQHHVPLTHNGPVRLAGEPYDPTRPTIKPPIDDMPGPMRAPPPLFSPPQQLRAASPFPNAPSNVRTNNAGKPVKTKLNLLNPMSLLARRRSSQRVAEATENSANFIDPVVPALRLPDNYDPRIRGKGVHDFSAPRSARSNQSPPKSSSGQETDNTGSQRSLSAPQSQEISFGTEKEHTPVFKENFDDDIAPRQGSREGFTKRQNASFMYQVALQEPYTELNPSTLPAFARNLPANFPGDTEPIARVASPPRAPLEIVHESGTNDSTSKEGSFLPSPPTSPLSKGRSRASSDTDSSFIPAGLPKHFKSNASRFSFDSAGVGSTAQEKLLEEKHRQKAKEKARASAESNHTKDVDGADEDEEDSDLDIFDDDDGIEEKIPGVNADADDEGLSTSISAMPAVTGIHPTQSSQINYLNTMSPVSEGFSPTSPQDAAMQPIAPTIYQASPNLSRDEGSPSSHRTSEDESQSHRDSGTSVDTDPVAESYNASQKPLDMNLPGQAATTRFEDDDDMYFDDGMIEGFEEGDGQAFDESVFDDETDGVYGVPLRDLPKQQQPMASVDVPGLPEPTVGTVREGYSLAMEEDDGRNGDDMITDELRDSLPDLNRPTRPVFSHTAGLTQDNLTAYHDALAMAANQAALNGKFTRRASLQSEQSNEQPGLDNDTYPAVGQSPSLEINGYPLAQNVPGSDDYDFDDAGSDDPIIAAANAEALENDDEDFYGQEFGFYARGRAGSGEYANGGYFGSGIQRTHSGRNAEPALTPITERSEWSNRNSAISLALHGYPPASLSQPTPGLAQLADMMHLEEDNMSLSALMKLRRGAWGSSTTSLQSSSGTSGSPLTYLPPMPSNAAALQYQQYNQSNNPATLNTQQFGASTHSLVSSTHSYSADDSPVASEGSHTLTLPQFTIPPSTNPIVSAPYMAPSYSTSGSESSPVQPPSPVKQARRKSALNPGSGKGHSRNGSKDGESVCYVHERDADGERWVLERRRVGEGGIIEILGREVVEGGRI